VKEKTKVKNFQQMKIKRHMVNWLYALFKGRVHCFSTQVVMNKSFLLNPEK